MAILANRVAVATATTGTGTVTLGAALPGFCTPAEASLPTGSVATWILTQGSDFQLFRGTYTAAGLTVSRDTTLLSKIGGTAGTANLSLDGTAEVRIVAAAQDMAIAGLSGTGIPNLTALDTWALLNYSTGTFTPTFTFATPGDLSVGYTRQLGYYRRIGDNCSIFYRMTWTPTYTTATGAALFPGLPFNAQAITNMEGAMNCGTMSGVVWDAGDKALTVVIAHPESRFRVRRTISGSAKLETNTAHFPSGTTFDLVVSGSYLV